MSQVEKGKESKKIYEKNNEKHQQLIGTTLENKKDLITSGKLLVYEKGMLGDKRKHMEN